MSLCPHKDRSTLHQPNTRCWWESSWYYKWRKLKMSDPTHARLRNQNEKWEDVNVKPRSLWRWTYIMRDVICSLTQHLLREIRKCSLTHGLICARLLRLHCHAPRPCCSHDAHGRHLLRRSVPPDPPMDTDISWQHGLQTEVSCSCQLSSAYITMNINITLPVGLWF